MAAPEESEDIIVEGLDAHVQAAHAAAARRLQESWRCVAGIDLHGDLHPIGQREGLSDLPDDRLQLGGSENGRGTAADVDRIEGREPLAVQGHLRRQGPQKGRHRGEVRDGVKAAVRALAVAKGDMEVKTGEGHVNPRRT